MSNQGKETTFMGHNYKADYKFKITQGQKANGEVQLKEARVMSDEIEGLIEVSFSVLVDWYKAGKEKHIKVVSPYEDDHEPQ